MLLAPDVCGPTSTHLGSIFTHIELPVSHDISGARLLNLKHMGAMYIGLFHADRHLYGVLTSLALEGAANLSHSGDTMCLQAAVRSVRQCPQALASGQV